MPPVAQLGRKPYITRTCKAICFRFSRSFLCEGSEEGATGQGHSRQTSFMAISGFRREIFPLGLVATTVASGECLVVIPGN